MHSIFNQPGYIWIKGQRRTHAYMISASRCDIKTQHLEAHRTGEL